MKIDDAGSLLSFDYCTVIEWMLKLLLLSSYLDFFFQTWKAKKDEEAKLKMAESARYKAYRRYMKKGGPGQMTFGPE